MNAAGCAVVTAIEMISVVALFAQSQPASGQRACGPATPPMTLTVTGFPDGGEIPVKFSQAAPGAAPVTGNRPHRRAQRNGV